MTLWGCGTVWAGGPCLLGPKEALAASLACVLAAAAGSTCPAVHGMRECAEIFFGKKRGANRKSTMILEQNTTTDFNRSYMYWGGISFKNRRMP